MRYILLCLLGLSLVSCKKSNEYNPTCEFSGKLCACDQTSQSPKTCTDYSKRSFSSAVSNCKGLTGGAFKDDVLCSSSGLVGTCVTTVGALQDFKRYYDNASTGSTDCGLIGGTWQ